MMGNVSEIEVNKVEKEMKDLLASTEKVEHAYKLVRDLLIFTDKRQILVDKQGVIGKKLSIIQFHIKVLYIFQSKPLGPSTLTLN